MNKLAIRALNVSKQYQIGAAQETYKTVRDLIVSSAVAPVQSIHRFFRGSKYNDIADENLIWAVQDVSFEVMKGEVIGIIGHNGAGKSTLLKILSRITLPSNGQIELNGALGTLLEVGTGFHPELTGRENIFFNGAVLGMKRQEVLQKFSEIVEFAEVERFIDTPVKHYSSGMTLRLAFAVAAHLEPEILIIDEVLAVGDAQFQKKCLGKMSDVSKQGRTVLFVSHNMAAVHSLCQRVLWLQHGQLVEDGDTATVVRHYLQSASEEKSQQKHWDTIELAPGNDQVRIKKAQVVPYHVQVSNLTTKTPIQLEFEYWNLVPDTFLNLSLLITNEQGVVIFNTFPTQVEDGLGKLFQKGLFRSRCFIPGNILNDGIYSVDLLVVKDQGVVIYRHDNIITFEVHDERDDIVNWYGKWVGAMRPMLKWETDFIEKV